MKKWYEVTLEKNKTIRVYAEDDETAADKAEQKLGTEWITINVRREEA